MSQPRWKKVAEIFHGVLDREAPQRQQYLEAACGDDSELKAEVESLIEAHSEDGPVDRLGREIQATVMQSDGLGKMTGQKLAQYEVGQMIGDGGMGAVFRARDERLDRTVALKFLLPHLIDVGSAKQRFLQEAQAAASLEHPNICTILEIGETDDGRLFIAMPLYDGTSLRTRLDEGSLPLDEIRDFTTQLCSGLAKAHGRGIVHRDIKPANVLVTKDGIVKILDFGVAKLTNKGITGTGAVIGTAAYMSPEQASGNPVDHRADIWSVGVMLYEMACGEIPFCGDNAAAMIHAVIHEQPVPLDVRQPGLPASLVRAVEKALAKDPLDRFQNMDELATALQTLEEAELAPTGLPRKRGSGSRGATLLPEGERRVATLLVTQIGDYDSLVERMSQLELDQLHERVYQLTLLCIARFGGIVNHSSGEEIISVFGIPTAHEDDTLRAARAAMALSEAVDQLGNEGESQPVALQSGIDSGRVVVQNHPTGGQRYRIVGDAVQTATRIAEEASGGEVVVSADCHRQLATFFTAEARGEVRLKGGRTTKPHRLLEETGRKSRLDAVELAGLTRYTGRQTEMAILRGRYDQAREGLGQFVSVVGEAGLGKSRLLYEFSQSLGGGDATVLWGRCQSDGQHASYLPFVEMLRECLGLTSPQHTDHELREVHGRLAEFGADLPSLLPLYLQVLSIESDEYALPAGFKDESLRAAMTQALIALFTTRASTHPVVMLLEDWHWADPASAAVLEQLIRVAPSFPLLLVATFRPDRLTDYSAHAHHTTIHLPPLGKKESGEILRSVLGATEAPETLEELVCERAGGNPFFMEEICQSLLEEGAIEVEAGRARLVDDANALTIPGTVQGVIRSRLDRMARRDRELLCYASVVGREFSRDILAHVYRDDAALNESLEQLVQAGVIQVTRILANPHYVFKHALTQDVAYESLLSHQRRDLHGFVGTAIQELRADRIEEYYPRLARHFAQAERWIEAVDYGLESAERAWKLTEFQESLAILETTESWLKRIEDAQEHRPRQIALLLRKERALELHGLRGRQQAVIDQLITILHVERDGAELAEVYIRLGDIHTLMGRFEKAEQALREGLELCHSMNNEELARKTMRSFGLMRWHSGFGDEALEIMREVVEADRVVGNSDQVIVDLVNISAVLRSMDRYEECRLFLAEALEETERSDNVVRRAYVLHNMALIARKEGRIDEALEILGSLINRYDEQGFLPQQQGFHLMTCGNIYWQQGDTDEAISTWKRAVSVLRKAQHADGLSQALQTLSEVFLGLDRVEEAVPYLEEAESVLDQLEDPASVGLICHSIGKAQAGLGEYTKAMTAWSRGRKICAGTKDLALELDIVEGMAAATRKHVPEPGLALHYYAEALSLAQGLGDLVREGSLHNTIAIIEWEGGGYEQAFRHYEKALELFREAGDEESVGLALNSMGVTLHKMGENEKALCALNKAVKFNQEADLRRMEGYSLAALGDLHYDAGRLQEALACYNQSLGIRREIEDLRGEGWMLHHLARTHAGLGALDRKRDCITAARKIADECGEPELISSLRELSS